MWQKIKPYLLLGPTGLVVGGLAAFLTRNDMDIYSELNQPPLSPPSILFPIVWSVLYLLMGIGAAAVYAKKRTYPNEVREAMALYGENLILNFAWNLIFFRFRALLFAFLWLLLLLLVIIRMIIAFRRVRPWAGYLQIPYAAWVAFASYLNLGTWLLNR